jgi:hypothetical protein
LDAEVAAAGGNLRIQPKTLCELPQAARNQKERKVLEKVYLYETS